MPGEAVKFQHRAREAGVITGDQTISWQGYVRLEDCTPVITRLRPIYEPEVSLTPKLFEGFWRILYTPRP